MVPLLFILLSIREMMFVASGMVLCIMAYKLFLAGITAGGAEEMTFGKYIKLKGGGPGIVFVALGAVIIVYTITTSGRMSPEELQILVSGDSTMLPALKPPTHP